VVWVFAFAAAVLFAQQGFDVASIKPMAQAAGGEGSSRPRIEHAGNRLAMRNVDIVDCVKWAYRVEDYQIVVSKEIHRDDYEILAQTSAPVVESQMRAMLQQLIAERFHLKFHRENRVMAVYELTTAKGGPKLPKANEESEDHHHVLNQLPQVRGGDFLFADSTLPEFAAKLSLLRGMDRPVIDRTGIAGYFDLTLKGGAAATRSPEEGPSLFTLVQEQFGLRLVPAKSAIEVVVIDSAERPAAN
jgi:uncharacterized protein (TIGR03435 family)